MDQFAWALWLLLGAALIIAEIFTLGFVLFWFGLGAIAAALVGFLGGGIGVQFLTFAVVSVALTAMSRTIFARYLPHEARNTIKTGVESLPGQIGTVAQASDGELNEAAVKVFGSIWTAYPVDGDQPLAKGEKVEVVEVRGSSIYVRKVGRELAGWKDG